MKKLEAAITALTLCAHLVGCSHTKPPTARKTPQPSALTIDNKPTSPAFHKYHDLFMAYLAQSAHVRPGRTQDTITYMSKALTYTRSMQPFEKSLVCKYLLPTAQHIGRLDAKDSYLSGNEKQALTTIINRCKECLTE